VYGDYRSPSPPADLVRALRSNEIDVAIVWGPLAGYFATRDGPPLALAPIPESEAPPGLTFAFDIGVGVRKGDAALAADLDAVLVEQKRAIDALLLSYGVPRL